MKEPNILSEVFDTCIEYPLCTLTAIVFVVMICCVSIKWIIKTEAK